MWNTRIIYTVSQLWLRCRPLCLPLLSQTSSWAPDLRRPTQHSVSHLSDKCLPPKQWVITELHLSGCTHLVWSAAFLLLLLVVAWHPQSAYQAPFLGMARRCFVSVCLYLFPPNFFLLFLLSPSFSSSPPCWPRHPNQMNKQIKWENKREQKRMFSHQGNKERSHLSSSLLASWLDVYSSHGVVVFLPSFQYIWCCFCQTHACTV